MLTIKIITTESADLDIIRTLLREYTAELNEDLCFQDFESEVKDPLAKYGPPAGVLLLAYYNEEPAACIAMRALKEQGVCEMKRLYVRPAYRKYGIGRQLVELLLTTAREKGYKKMKLDTMQRMAAAIALYERYGFIKITPYYNNPLADAVYMEKELG